VRWGLVTGNLLLLLCVGAFLLSNRSASQTVRSSTTSSATTTARSLPSPLDQLSSDQIALQAAQLTDLPELTMVRNRADSASAQLAVVPNDTTTLAKPQIVSTAQKSRYDIAFYIVKKGDTVKEIAADFGVDANSIRWSNNLDGDSLNKGDKIIIPPADGVVYKVKDGDTINSIVSKYSISREIFITVNDAEKGIYKNELVWIPNGQQPAVLVPQFAIAPTFSGTISGGYYYTGPCISNGYDCGWCTWWAANRWAQTHGSPFPQGLGDAYSWASLAGPVGHLAVDVKPRSGAVIWFNGNHVGFVESVKSDGSVYVSEMNELGWNIVSNRTIPAAQATGYKYIY
jgi:N-acetylmuramoyl-L-alanine amidase